MKNQTADGELEWHKSSHSGGDNECVEVASRAERIVSVRDSKDRSGPTLSFDSGAWQKFISALQAGEFHPN